MEKHRRRSSYNSGVNFPIEASSTFEVSESVSLQKLFDGEAISESETGYIYSRHYNPTVLELGNALAEMENAEAGYCTASGMSAIACALLGYCQSGDHILAEYTLYGGTHALLANVFPQKFGIDVTFVDVNNPEDLKKNVRANTRVLYAETIANPVLSIADLPSMVAFKKQHNLSLVIDNTFSPEFVKPIDFGADCVVHSLTKYVSGESDIVAGAICGSSDFISSLMDLHSGSVMLLGPTMDPHIASRLLNRLPHLGMRIKEQSRRASIYAHYLEECGLKIIYPGLKTHPQHHLSQNIFHPDYGFGGVFCIDLGTLDKAYVFGDALRSSGFARIAVSLGYYDTLISFPSETTHSEFDEHHLSQAEITDGLIRVSVGYTGTVAEHLEKLAMAVQSL